MLAFDPDIRNQAYQFFAQESLDFLQTIEAGLLTLSHDRSVPKIHTLMRAAHSIKGGAASVGLPAIQHLAHHLEDVFRVLYRQEIDIDFALEDLLLQAYDRLKGPLIEQLQTGHHDADLSIQQGDAIFAQLADRLGDALQNLDHELPTAEELGVDIVQAIFSGDVQAGLDRLTTVLAHPTDCQLAGEIRAQADVFIGVGQLVNLPGFTQIGQTVLAALSAHPQQAFDIGQLALADFQSAQMAVLAGDRAQGGSPSEALQALVMDDEPALSIEPELQINQADLEDLFGADVPAVSSSEDVESVSSPGLNQVDAVLPAIDFLNPQLPVTNGSFTSSTPLPELDFLSTEVASLNGSATSNVKETIPTQDVADPLTAQPDSPYLSNRVRVDLSRLERLNNLVGELVTQENSAILQNQQLQGLVARIIQRFTRFEQISHELETWTDRSQNERARLQAEQTGIRSVKPSVSAIGLETSWETTVDFDPLQMDTYSDLYTLVQETMEEIAQLGEAMRDMSLLTQQSQQIQRQKQQTLKQVRNDLLWARMIPLGDVLQNFPRMVRDLCAKHQKQVTVKLTGVNTLVDKSVLEKLYDPLVHLVRNAFDHGIEPPSIRAAQGKSAPAKIDIRAYHRGNQTYIEVQDNGRGIDLEVVRAKAIALELVSAEAAPTLAPEQLYEFLFSPGFTTAAKVSDLSGRGVGLDTVRSQVHNLKGAISVASELGQGTVFTLRLPLTLTIAKLLVFSLNSHLMAIPIDTLVEIVAAPVDQLQTVQGEQFFRWQDKLIPIYPASVFSQNYLLIKPTSEQIQAMSIPQNGRVPLLLIAGEDQTIALQVDQILQEQELVIKPFGAAISPPAYLYGCTILGDGSLVPVIDGPALVQQKQGAGQSSRPVTIAERETTETPRGPEFNRSAQSSLATILVVDDSLTTRQNLALTLKKAGYRVVQARDGREALDHLQQEPGIQGVFCDVEMPRMNGFEFLNHCRQKRSKTELPVIMLSSRSSEKHRQVAKLMGATDYLTKPYLEQDLLKTLRSYL